MTGSDKIIMTINIGGERFEVKTPFDSQKKVREAEKAADTLAQHMRKSFPMASDSSVLARVAYRLATKYLEVYNENAEGADLAREASEKLDALLQKA